MNFKVSAIIPTYNRAAEVCKAIESALTQTFGEIEVLVVDDGSTDGTGKILHDIFGDRIRYFAQSNQGVGAARNNAIAEARGEWIAFLDSDDLWEKDKIEWQIKALERFGPRCGASYTDARLFNHPETRTLFQLAERDYHHEKTMGINTEALEHLVRPPGAGMLIPLDSVMARADLVRRTGGFDPRFRFGEDSQFLVRLAMLTDFCYVNLPLLNIDRRAGEIRHTGVSTDWNKFEFVNQQAQFRLESYLRMNDGLPMRVRKLVREQLSLVHSGWTNWYLQKGQYGNARGAVSRAARLDLRFSIAVKWLLTWISPRLALRTVRRYRKGHNEPARFM
jgi:glycosyltransferase involved in cell wall biosynthesis